MLWHFVTMRGIWSPSERGRWLNIECDFSFSKTFFNLQSFCYCQSRACPKCFNLECLLSCQIWCNWFSNDLSRQLGVTIKCSFIRCQKMICLYQCNNIGKITDFWLFKRNALFRKHRAEKGNSVQKKGYSVQISTKISELKWRNLKTAIQGPHILKMVKNHPKLFEDFLRSAQRLAKDLRRFPKISEENPRIVEGHLNIYEDFSSLDYWKVCTHFGIFLQTFGRPKVLPTV